jgi:hypothetical protein
LLSSLSPTLYFFVVSLPHFNSFKCHPFCIQFTRATHFTLLRFHHHHVHRVAGTLVPGCGSLVSFLETATGVDPITCGKPSETLAQILVAEHGVDTSKACMVGDRLDTDIKFGQVPTHPPTPPLTLSHQIYQFTLSLCHTKFAHSLMLARSDLSPSLTPSSPTDVDPSHSHAFHSPQLIHWLTLSSAHPIRSLACSNCL